MSLDIAEIKKYLPVFTEELMAEIANYGLIKEIPEGVEILKEGQYIQSKETSLPKYAPKS